MKFTNATKIKILQADLLTPIGHYLASIKRTWQRNLVTQTSFPKKCSKCGKVFENMEAFNRDTDRLARGREEVCYVINREVKIYQFRNCPSPCHSTLVTVSNERRDLSFEGRRRRQTFDRIFETLSEVLEINDEELHSLVLYITRAVSYEGMNPDESIQLLKQDIRSNRFEGFPDEIVMLEKIDTH